MLPSGDEVSELEVDGSLVEEGRLPEVSFEERVENEVLENPAGVDTELLRVVEVEKEHPSTEEDQPSTTEGDKKGELEDPPVALPDTPVVLEAEVRVEEVVEDALGESGLQLGATF